MILDTAFNDRDEERLIGGPKITLTSIGKFEIKENKKKIGTAEERNYLLGGFNYIFNETSQHVESFFYNSDGKLIYFSTRAVKDAIEDVYKNREIKLITKRYD
jgi:hypothetical protein